MRRKQNVNGNMYKQLMEKITVKEWQRFWGQVKKVTAPGKSGVTTDMMNILGERELESMRRMTNMVLVPGLQVYDHWKERIISPIPKDEGNYDIDRARPLI